MKKKCESCLAGFSKEDVMANCTCGIKKIFKSWREEFEFLTGGNPIFMMDAEDELDITDKIYDYIFSVVESEKRKARIEGYIRGKNVRQADQIAFKNGYDIGKQDSIQDIRDQLRGKAENTSSIGMAVSTVHIDKLVGGYSKRLPGQIKKIIL